MIGYTTLGTNDFKKSGTFYDHLFAELGARRIMEDDHIILWSNKPGAAMIAVIKPYNGQPATVGNGAMVALSVKDPAAVESLHTKALELGATCEGAPGPRGSNMNFAYIRDLEGNKLAFYCMT